MNYNSFMQFAIAEAKASLKEGNHGFGAVIVKDDQIIAGAHDREETDSDPTSHAELNAIRIASRQFGKDLSDCTLISTHEPCPMCATAVVWSGIKTVAYGYSITEAITEGRSRINLTCKELFEKAKAAIQVHEGILHDQCSILYRQDVRAEIKKLRGAREADLHALSDNLQCKRIAWYQKNQARLNLNHSDPVMKGYQLLLQKLEIQPEEAPIVLKSENKVVFHSKNFCPTLEACKILDLDTRIICKTVNEQPTDALIKQINHKLEFRRNYEKFRPYCDYCEEMVILKP